MKMEIVYKGDKNSLTVEEKKAILTRLDELKALYGEADFMSVVVTVNDDGINIAHEVFWPKFERIRRITGYLVGSIDKWNNAKKAEESERIKHTAA